MYFRIFVTFAAIVTAGTLFALSTSVSAQPATYAVPMLLQNTPIAAPEESTPLPEITPIISTEPEEIVVESKIIEPAPENPDERSIEHPTQIPFFSQFTDISDPKWRKVGCGIASLAMLIEFYKPGSVSVDTLLDEGIASGAYLDNAGWTHRGLANLAEDYGLFGTPHDLSPMSMDDAFAEIKSAVEEGPVIASVHYTFDPKNPIPHLVVINGIKDNTVYYNDPAEDSGNGTLTAEKFMDAWKKRYIEVRESVG